MASKWFERLSPSARQAYLRSHPKSKFKSSKPTAKAKTIRPSTKKAKPSRSGFALQPDGSWKKGGDSRSATRTATELRAKGININAKRPTKKVGMPRM